MHPISVGGTVMPQTSGRVPFPYTPELKRFEQAFSESLRAHLDMKRAEFMPPENVQVYRHGTSWRSDSSSHPDEISELQSHEHGLTIRWQDIIADDLSVMKRIFVDLGERMHGTIVREMYAKVSEAAESVGNTLSLKDVGSHAKAFLEMLRKIEFGVDREGKPSLPQFHASSEMIDAFLADLQSQGPDFEEQVRDIMKNKIAAAQERERVRRSKFAVMGPAS
jgi:hypothetical protein